MVLRRGSVQDGTPDLLVVAVDANGREREIARLPGRAGPWAGNGYYHPPAAISPNGLLAIPRGPGNQMHWEIIDLRRPGMAPLVVRGIEQDVEQLQGMPYFSTDMRPGIFWGPGDRLAIPWYERMSDGGLDYHVSFVDGRTRDATAVDVPVDPTSQEELAILPEWARDGSAIIISTGRFGEPGQRSLLRRDGPMSDDSMEIGGRDVPNPVPIGTLGPGRHRARSARCDPVLVHLPGRLDGGAGHGRWHLRADHDRPRWGHPPDRRGHLRWLAESEALSRLDRGLIRRLAGARSMAVEPSRSP